MHPPCFGLVADRIITQLRLGDEQKVRHIGLVLGPSLAAAVVVQRHARCRRLVPAYRRSDQAAGRAAAGTRVTS